MPAATHSMGFTAGLGVVLNRLLNWNELTAPEKLMKMLGPDASGSAVSTTPHAPPGVLGPSWGGVQGAR